MLTSPRHVCLPALHVIGLMAYITPEALKRKSSTHWQRLGLPGWQPNWRQLLREAITRTTQQRLMMQTGNVIKLPSKPHPP